MAGGQSWESSAMGNEATALDARGVLSCGTGNRISPIPILQQKPAPRSRETVGNATARAIVTTNILFERL
jgi:hypothetical protein